MFKHNKTAREAAGLADGQGLWSRNFRWLMVGFVAMYTWNGLVVAMMQPLAGMVSSSAAIQSLVGAIRKGSAVPAGLLGGVIADRVNRRRLVAASALMSAAALSLFAAAEAFGVRSMALLVVVAALTGVGSVGASIAQWAMVKRVAAVQHHTTAHSRVHSVRSTFGQLLPGLVIFGLFQIGPWAPIVAAAIFAVLTSVFVLMVDAELGEPGPVDGSTTGPRSSLRERFAARKIRKSQDDRGESVREQLAGGFRYIGGVRTLWVVELSSAVFNMSIGMFSPLLAYYAVHWLHLPMTGFGILLVLSSSGMILGNAAADRLMRRFRAWVLLTAGYSACVVTYVAMTVSHEMWWAVVTQVVFGLAAGMVNPVISAVRQHVTDQDFLGRVSAVGQTASDGLPAVTAPLGAVVVALGGVAGLMWGTAAGIVLAVVVVVVFRSSIEDPTPAESAAAVDDDESPLA